MKKLILTVRNVVLLIFIVIIGIISYYTFMVGINDYNVVNVFYKNKSNIDYKVYLFKNKYFEEPYLGKDRTYISSLIDYIDIDFDYDLKFDDLVSGNYNYYIKGTILADKASGTENDSYWSKTYVLKNPEIIRYDAVNGFDIQANIKVDYQKYNKLLVGFKNAYGLTIDGKFRIDLVVESNSSTNKIKHEMPIKSVASLVIPLTQKTIDLSIDLDTKDDTNSFSERTKINDPLHILFCIIAGVLGIIDIVLIIILFKGIRKLYMSQTEYDKQINRILETYDGIIVNIRSAPKYDKMNVIKVENFEELIDAHSEVRKPINYVKLNNGKQSKFFLINENMVWEYTISADKVNNKEKEKDN